MIYRCPLPRPPSVNAMYANVSNAPAPDPITGKLRRGGRVKSRAYKAWREAASRAMMANGPRPAFSGPVRITLEIGTIGLRAKIDGDNMLKPVFDLLVHMQVIPDDGRTAVKSGAFEWRDGLEGAIVTVEDVP